MKQVDEEMAGCLAGFLWGIAITLGLGLVALVAWRAWV